MELPPAEENVGPVAPGLRVVEWYEYDQRELEEARIRKEERHRKAMELEFARGFEFIRGNPDHHSPIAMADESPSSQPRMVQFGEYEYDQQELAEALREVREFKGKDEDQEYAIAFALGVAFARRKMKLRPSPPHDPQSPDE